MRELGEGTRLESVVSKKMAEWGRIGLLAAKHSTRQCKQLFWEQEEQVECGEPALCWASSIISSTMELPPPRPRLEDLVGSTRVARFSFTSFET